MNEEIYHGIVIDEPKHRATPEEARAWYEKIIASRHNLSMFAAHRAALVVRFTLHTGCKACGRPTDQGRQFPAICVECDVWAEQITRRIKWRLGHPTR